MDYRFTDLVNIPRLRELMGSFYWLIEVSIGVIDADGNWLFVAGWQNSCDQFYDSGKNTGNNLCECRLFISQSLLSGQYANYKCPSGMMHYTSPILIGERQLASLYIGQFFIDPKDKEAARAHAASQSKNASEHLAALEKASVIPRMKLSLLLKFLQDFAVMLAEMGLGRLEQLKSLELLRQSEESLRFFSRNDPLTGVHNRAWFEEMLQQLETQKVLPIGIIMCDIDDLKKVNDTEGHSAGDAVLKAGAQAISKAVGPGCPVARIGGDEFAVLLSGVTHQEIDCVQSRIMEEVDAFCKQHPTITLGISSGSAWSETQPQHFDELFKEADQNMYMDKIRRGKFKRRSSDEISKTESLKADGGSKTCNE